MSGQVGATMSIVNGYDYVIVGAGSAGCVLANRLTEDTGATVLLLEAGGHDRHPYIQVPIGIGKLQQHRMFDWGYESDPEPHLNGRRIRVLRGGWRVGQPAQEPGCAALHHPA
jgi:4-pyridoxate dehydrogenase